MELPGYDEWKTTEPQFSPEEEEEYYRDRDEAEIRYWEDREAEAKAN